LLGQGITGSPQPRKSRPGNLVCEVDGGISTGWASGPMATPKTGDRPDLTSSLELGTASFRGSAAAVATPTCSVGGVQVPRPSTANSCGTPTGRRPRAFVELDRMGAMQLAGRPAGNPPDGASANPSLRRQGSFGQSRGLEKPAVAPLGTEVCQPTVTYFQPSGLSTPKTADRPDLNSSLMMGSATFRGSATPTGHMHLAGFNDPFVAAHVIAPSTPSSGRRISNAALRTGPLRRPSGVSLRAS